MTISDTFRIENFEIPADRQYWFVRTIGGHMYDLFLDNDVIGLVYGYISKKDLDTLSDEEILNKIFDHQKLDKNNPNSKRKARMILNKCRLFLSIKEGDVIIIPSYSSEELAFGLAGKLTNFDNDVIDLQIQRKVDWYFSSRITKLHPQFMELKSYRHAITKITTNFEEVIDRESSGFYVKKGLAHLVLRTAKNENITEEEFIQLYSATLEVLKKCYELAGEEYEEDNLFLKLAIASPGFIERIRKHSMPLFLFFGMILLSSCEEHEREEMYTNYPELKQAEMLYQQTDSLESIVDTMSVTVRYPKAEARKLKQNRKKS